MGNKYLMALDAGSGSGRCVLVSLDGEHLFATKKDWQYFTPEGLPGSAFEFDPDQFWGILANTIRETLQKAHASGEDILGISSTSQREGIVILDQGGHELYAGPNRDFRAPMEGMTIAGKHGEEIYQRTGHYPSGIFACARLQWFKNNQPEKYEKMATLLSINDWILYRLCGVKVCEPTNASETALYDIHNKQWAFDLIDKLNLKNIFTEVQPAGTRIGTVTHLVEEMTGLKAGTPVVVGGADTQCGLLGIGFHRPKAMGAISGTTTPVQMILDEAVIDEQQRTWTSPYLIQDMFVLESNAGSSGSIFQWVHDTFCESEIMKSDPQKAFSLMAQLAEQAQPGASGMLSHVGINIMNAKKLGAPPSVFHFGMSPISSDFRSSKPAFLRAVIESLAYGVKANADQITEILGYAPEKIGVCGGLTNANLYNQILANLFQMEVRVPKWRESTGVGAAICAGVGAGVFNDLEEGVSQIVKDEITIEPDPQFVNKYRSLYKKWMRSYQKELS